MIDLEQIATILFGFTLVLMALIDFNAGKMDIALLLFAASALVVKLL